MSPIACFRRTTHVLAPALLLPWLLCACSRTADEPQAEPTAQVQVVAASVRDLDDAVTAYGVVEGVAGEDRAVSTQVEAQVAEVYVQSGESVRQGQKLLRLLPSAVTALEAGRAQRDALAAQVEVQRVARLREQSLATESEWQAAKAASESAAALSESLAARTGQAAGREITAPLDGVVEALTARTGELITAGAVVLRVEAPVSRIVRLGLEADALKGVHAGEMVQLADLREHPVGAARVQSVDLRLDAQSGLATVLVRADAALRVPVGMRLRARIIRATHAGAVAVARSAVLYEADRAHVFVVRDGKAARRDVRVGLLDADWLEILEGVAAGEAVVTVGNDELADAMAVQIQEPAAEASEP